MTPQWQPYREPLLTTLSRTVAIAVGVGAVLAMVLGGLSYWPGAIVIVLWFSFGGHWVELLFLNHIRPGIPGDRTWQFGVRLAVWFAGGVFLAQGMRLTASAMASAYASKWPPWWVGGLAFIGVELVVHIVLQILGKPSVYNGRG